MNKDDINEGERVILSNLAEMYGLDQFNFDVLWLAYKSIKIQGSAHSIDSGQILSLGIPMTKALATIKELQVSDIVNQINNGSITYEDVKQAFIRMTSEGAIYHKKTQS